MLSRPAIIRSSVVLPEPDGPRNTTNSPDSISRLTSRITSTEPNRFETPDKSRFHVMQRSSFTTIISDKYPMSRKP